VADRVYTPAEIAESKRQAQLAWEQHRSDALRRNTTTTGVGSSGALSAADQDRKARGALSKPKPARSGILGYVADAYDRATGQ
jgi:hypothetical protein